MYQILDFFAIYFGLTQMKSKDGETMTEAFHSYLVKILLKNFAKNMIWTLLSGDIRLLKMVMSSLREETSLQSFLPLTIVVNLITTPLLCLLTSNYAANFMYSSL